ncbi:MAG: lytic transglycosylase domain-containing protein [Oligoflexia bacterium]|nr:lytic transglycosylase domain-containing protein [Oligoflexia bacterium]
MRFLRCITLSLLPLFFASVAGSAMDNSGLGSVKALPSDSPTRKSVDFWIRIYTQYGTDQGLIHDSKYLDKVYEVIDHPTDARILQSRRHWESVLLSVQGKLAHPETFDADELRVYKMYDDVHEPDKFIEAAHRKRLRFQLGQKNRFIQGIEASGRYLPQMEEVFRKAGLPVELTRLPFVESGFNVRARSKVGASGVWQFMRSTGQLFLRINDAVDERNDPVRAAEAAAQLLKGNYESLQSWPLAVTAYNHGRKGMMRAVRKVGSDRLDDLIESYRSRSFGFASGNFYAELLASIEVEKHAEQYFGKVRRDPPIEAYEVPLPASINFRDLCRFLRLDRDQLRDLNPGINDAAWAGRRGLPAGYRLRLPSAPGADHGQAARVFLAGFAEIPKIYKHSNTQF